MTVATPPRAADETEQRVPKSPWRRRFGRDRTTPGVLGALLVGSAVTSLVAGTICAVLVFDRDQRLHQLATADGPLHAAAEEFSRSLSTANVAASAAFLARDEGMATDRVRYETEYESAAGEAQSALATLVASRNDETAAGLRGLLGTLPGRLAEYTVLVEQARAYNRLDKPVASTYQLLAADAMQANLLPAAQRLYDSVTEQLAAHQRDATDPPWLELALGGVLLTVLAGTQVYLWRRTNRVFNVGLVAATLAALAMIGWLAIASFTANQSAERSRVEGTDVINSVTLARTTGLAARANESLIPVSSRDDHEFDAYERGFQRLAKRLSSQLAEARSQATEQAARAAITEAAGSVETWTSKHSSVRQAATNGEQRASVQRLITSRANAAFGAFDDALAAAVDDTRLRFDAHAASAHAAFTGVLIGVISLTLLTAAGATVGVWQRLREYR